PPDLTLLPYTTLFRSCCPGGRPRLAPLPEEKYQELLAGGLHAVFAERELRRRFSLAQQADAVSKAARELAHVEITALRGVLDDEDRKSTRLNSSHVKM